MIRMTSGCDMRAQEIKLLLDAVRLSNDMLRILILNDSPLSPEARQTVTTLIAENDRLLKLLISEEEL